MHTLVYCMPRSPRSSSWSKNAVRKLVRFVHEPKQHVYEVSQIHCRRDQWKVTRTTMVWCLSILSLWWANHFGPQADMVELVDRDSSHRCISTKHPGSFYVHLRASGFPNGKRASRCALTVMTTFRKVYPSTLLYVTMMRHEPLSRQPHFLKSSTQNSLPPTICYLIEAISNFTS